MLNQRKSKGITLISLIITIIIILILAGITLVFIFREDGILNRARQAGVEYTKESIREEIQLAVSDIRIELLSSNLSQSLSKQEIVDNLPSKLKGITITSDLKGEYKKFSYWIDDNYTVHMGVVDTNGLIFKIANNQYEDGIHHITILDETYEVQIINYKEDVVYNKDNPVENIGNSNVDGEMLVLKYHKNLTIEQGQTLTPAVRRKGMYLCILGELDNNGEITMTAKGAKAEGQNVYLYENQDGIYETVPADGGEGAQKAYAYKGSTNTTWLISYNVAENAVGRQTGGGSSGIACGLGYAYTYSGAGAAGTSYSGGSGGGGCSARYQSTSNKPTYYAQDGEANGGKGGDAKAYRPFTEEGYYTSGGAGNDGGYGAKSKNLVSSMNTSSNGNNGTGGLLIIYANQLNNNGVISSKGVNGGMVTSTSEYYPNGGASGGGSINIFYLNGINEGNIFASGGLMTVYGNEQIRAGGDGSITITKIH